MSRRSSSALSADSSGSVSLPSLSYSPSSCNSSSLDARSSIDSEEDGYSSEPFTPPHSIETRAIQGSRSERHPQDLRDERDRSLVEGYGRSLPAIGSQRQRAHGDGSNDPPSIRAGRSSRRAVVSQKSSGGTSVRPEASKTDSAASSPITQSTPSPPGSSADIPQSGLESRLAALNLASPAAGGGAPEYLYPTSSEALSELLSTNEVPSLIYSEDTISSGKFSVPSSIASAVSGVQTFDPETGQWAQREPSPFFCRFDYWRCRQTFPPDQMEAWMTHEEAHFELIGPPIRGAVCRLCRERFAPDRLTHMHVAGPPLSEDQMRDYEAKQQQYRKQMKKGIQWCHRPVVHRQARMLWRLLQKHVAQHFLHGYSNAASGPDDEIIRYLRNMDLMLPHEFKFLTSGMSIEAAEPVTSPGPIARELDCR